MKDLPCDPLDLRNLTSFEKTMRDTAKGRTDAERSYEFIIAHV